MTTKQIHETVRRVTIEEARELLDVAVTERFAARQNHDASTAKLEAGDVDRMPLDVWLDLQQSRNQVRDLLIAIANKTRTSADADEYMTVEKPRIIAREEADSIRRCGLQDA